MKRRLIILGASARAAAFSAARAGFEPFAIDLFADYDLAALCPARRIEKYPHGFLRALAAAPDAPWIYAGGLENYPRLVARLAALRPLWGNASEALRAIRDPQKLARALSEEGLRSPRQWSGDNRVPQRWLVKPRRSSAGLGIRFATQADLANSPRGAFEQEFIEGESCSATFVAAGGTAVLLGAARQLIGREFGLSPEFLYVGSIGPLELRGEEQTKLTRLGQSLAQRFMLIGLFGVDFIRTADELWTVEVNPRYSASIEVLERVTGKQFIALHAAACELGVLPDPPLPSASGHAGKAVVYARHHCHWVERTVDPEMTLVPFSWPDLADIPQQGQVIRAGQPVATVFATGESSIDVQQQLRWREAEILARLAGA